MTDSARSKPEIDFYDGPEPTELVIRDIEVGTGAEAYPGATVDVHYLGVDFESGEEFDSSWSRNASIEFPLAGLIKGWQEGIPGMKVGGGANSSARRSSPMAPRAAGTGSPGAP